MGFVKNINAWKTKSDAAKRRIQGKATDYVRKQVLTVFKEALRVSPQWSGNYAANWQLSFTGAAGGKGWDKLWKVDDWREVTPRQAGDARSYRQTLEFWTEIVNRQLYWNSTVKLENHAPVADMIESGEVKLRPQNLIPGGQGVIAYLNMKFKYLGK